MSEDKPDIGYKIVAFPLGIALAGLLLWFDGFVMTRLWSWFVVPMGVSALPIWTACGLCALVGFLRASSSAAAFYETAEEDWDAKRRFRNAYRAVKQSALGAAWAYAVGWAIVTWFKP